MAKDRLPELLQRSISASSSNGSLLQVDIKMSGDHYAPVDAILNPYAEIRTLLATIDANVEAMSRMVQTINIRNFNENEMDDLRTQNLKIGNDLMIKFKDFKANLPTENDYRLEARMKRTLFYGLHQTYINVWNKNEIFLQSYEAKLKKNLQLHSRIMSCNSTEEEVEELIANKTTNLFVGNILEETEKERKTLRDLMGRLSELKKLEKSIEDVHVLFLRIQTLVMEQSDTVQLVEYHAQQATLFVDKGTFQLDEAKKLKKRVLKTKICLIIVVAAVLVVFILVAFFA